MFTQPNNPQPQLRAVPMNLFPVMNSLDEVVELAKSKLPMESHNEIHCLLMTYHNSLLNQLKNQ